MSPRGSQDAALSLMKTYNLPMTMETYLNIAYAGKPPEMTAELLDQIPEEIREAQSNGILSK